ncbi:uncharacterized protein LOC112685848 [Sipha flava]|uniref:Uncharacterized protein LOC112685848 n=1 Tax=Sipha flava TaxID=143950 RepID=A0A8B8FSB3_9HEMI|nr:uncharacterized protein LOC112685848 [Sipha flava]
MSSDLIIFDGLIEIESSALRLQFSRKIWCSIFFFFVPRKQKQLETLVNIQELFVALVWTRTNIYSLGFILNEYRLEEFCALRKYCEIFANNTVGKRTHQKLGALIIKPFTKWKDAIERFNHHSTSEYHKLSIIRSEEFIKVMENKKSNIANEIDTSQKKQVIENRAILHPIIQTIILCGKQNIALRGNNDSGKIYNESIETNDGNFRSLLRFKSLADSVLDKHLKNATSFASYTSPNVQNEIITICVDEKQDISRLEQMSFCVRYVDGVSNCIMEDFLEFSIVHDMTGKGLSTSILQLLEKFGLEINFL